MICRDATLTDLELMAQAGFHLVWLDLEHSPQSMADMVRLSRTIIHLGMLPIVRIPELLRTHVQPLADAGVPIIALPDIRDTDQAKHFVQLSKFPPLGQRGFSSTSAGIGFSPGSDIQRTLRQANDASHLMVLFESDVGYRALDAILAVEGIDIVTVGPMDWAISLGRHGDMAQSQLSPKIEHVLRVAAQAGKITAMTVSSPQQADDYFDLGVRLFFLGVDVAIKRSALTEMIGGFHVGLGSR